MTQLSVKRLSKVFVGRDQPPSRAADQIKVEGIKDVSFTIDEGQIFTLLGPSGCGKTTILRCIAGLEYPDSGRIVLGKRVLYDSAESIVLRPNQRGLGMVFQSYAIWPNMNVFKNVAYPLTVLPRARRPSRKVIRQRVDRWLTAVGLDHAAKRPATDLSGGQQQRLALARALVAEPPLLLLDEPLSNLDAKLREHMRRELTELQRQTNVTTLYVTHDQVEALAMSDVIAVMGQAGIEQVAPRREIYERPASRYVADFVGATNLIEAKVQHPAGNGEYVVYTDLGELLCTSPTDLAPNDAVTVSIRPESIILRPADGGSPAANAWVGAVRSQTFLGDAVDHLVDVGSSTIKVRCNPSGALAPGTTVSIHIPITSAILLLDNTEDE